MTTFIALVFVLVAPATARAQNPDLDSAVGVEWTGEVAAPLLAKATELATPAAIYHFVRNNYRYVPYSGLEGGSVNTFFAGYGNNIDLASLLIAMLRSQGYPARYAVGEILLPAADAQSWLRVGSMALALKILDRQGVNPVEIIGADEALRTKHVWVEALVPMLDYRGAGADPQGIDCGVSPELCTWVALDPSFKLHDFHGQDFNILDNVSFNYLAYYNARVSQDPQLLNKNPLEIYEDQILAYLRTTFPDDGNTLADVMDPGEIVRDDQPVLPASLPYELFTNGSPPVISRYSSAADHDLNLPSGEAAWQKILFITAYWQVEDSLGRPQFDPDNPDPTERLLVHAQGIADYFKSIADLSTRALGLTFQPCETGDCTEAVFLLDGQPVLTRTVLTPPLGISRFVIHLELTRLDEISEPIHATYFNNVLDGDFTFAGGGETANWEQFHRSARSLLAISEQFPLVENSSGVPYVDRSQDGNINNAELPLAEDHEARQALTGGLLESAIRLYHARHREATKRLDALNHVRSPIAAALGSTRTRLDVQNIDGTPFGVAFKGLVIDMKAVVYLGTLRDEPVPTDSDPHFELLAHIGSSLEHEVWQELTGLDALSTVRGIQDALAAGAELVEPKRADGIDTLPSLYVKFGFGPSAPLPFQLVNAVVTTLEPDIPFAPYYAMLFFGADLAADHHHLWEPTYWTLPAASQGSGIAFHALRAIVDDQTPLHLRNSIFFSDNATAVGAYVSFLEDLSDNTEFLNGRVLSRDNSSIAGRNTPCFLFLNVLFSTGPVPFTTPGRASLETYHCWNWAFRPQSTTSSFYLFDRQNGFDPQDYVYRRSDDLADSDQRTETIHDIRDSLNLGFELGQQMERGFVIPSMRTSANATSFEVFIRKEKSPEKFVLQFAIGDETFQASGAITSTSPPLTQADPNEFDNSQLSESVLNPTVNNDLQRAPITDDPISTVTGNMYMDEQDFFIRGRGLDLLLTRTYNSGAARKATSNFPLGKGWTHSYNMRLISNDFGEFPDKAPADAPENTNLTTSSITYRDERGGELNYLVDDSADPPSFAISPPRGVFDTLALDTPSSGFATLKFRNDVEYVFRVVGGSDLTVPGTIARLDSIKDPFGNVIDLNYDETGNLEKVTDDLTGRTGLEFTYYPAAQGGQLHTVSDWTERHWTYAYDAEGRLFTATNPLEETFTYLYHGDTPLLTNAGKPLQRDLDGTPVDVKTIFEYFDNGKAFSQKNALGEGETVSYDLYRKQTRVTDPRGFNREFGYTRSGLLAKLSLPDGAVLLFDHNDEGLRNKKTNALGFATEYSYCTDPIDLDGAIKECNASDSGGNVTVERDPLQNDTLLEYGPFDQITGITDRRGHVTSFSYYGSEPLTGAKEGKLHEIQATVNGEADVLLESRQYMPDGNLWTRTEYIDPADLSKYRRTTFTYKPNGVDIEQIVTSSPGGETSVVHEFTYDSLGRTKSETLHRSNTPTDLTTILFLRTEFDYDELDRQTLVRDPAGNETKIVYDENGKVFKVIRRFRRTDGTFKSIDVSTREYDAADRLISDTDALGGKTQFAYDSAGNLVSRIDANGNITRFEYDSMGRQTAVVDANGHRTETRYNLAGQVIATIDPTGGTTTRQYDKGGRLELITNPNQEETKFAYDETGNLSDVTDAKAMAGDVRKNADGSSEHRVYDELNRVKMIVSADVIDSETFFEYDLLGNRTKVKDAEESETKFIYDGLGRMVRIEDPIIESPADLVTTFTYDQAGNVLTEIDRKGQEKRFTYDDLNRLERIDYLADGTAEVFTYSLEGNLETAGNQDATENPEVTYTFTYDDLNRLETKLDSRLGRDLAYEYDAVGNLIQKTDYQGDVTTLQYDGTNRLVALQNPAYLQVSYHYDPAGRLLNRILSNGAQTDYQYDPAGRLLKLTNRTASGLVIESEQYARDPVGNIETRISSVTGTTQYAYDPRYRLLSATYSDPSKNESFEYDLVGNRRTHTTAAAGLHTYLYGPSTTSPPRGNRLQEIWEGPDLLRKFEYDENGSLEIRRNGAGAVVQSFEYDAKNRVSRILTGGVQNTFKYDPFDLRIEKVIPGATRTYLLEAEHLEAIYDENANLKAKFLRGVVIDEVVNAYYFDGNGKPTNYTYHHDALQSVVGLSSHAGTVKETLRYGSFGGLLEQTGGSPSSLRFTGREFDSDTGLYYYRARYYDPEDGRFLSEDPLGFDGGDVNLYAYVGNNPLRFNDPRGLVTPDTLLDLAFIAADLAAIRDQGLNLVTGTALALDVVGAAIPLATGLGAGFKTLVGLQSKSAQVVKANARVGRAAEGVVEAQLLAEGATILGMQVSARTSAGLRRIDFVVKTADGRLIAVEAKSGGGARNASQLLKDSLLASEGGVLVGKNVPALLRTGDQLVLETVERGVSRRAAKYASRPSSLSGAGVILNGVYATLGAQSR